MTVWPELLELADQCGVRWRGGAGRSPGKVAVVDLVMHHMPLGDQQVVASRADGVGQAGRLRMCAECAAR